MKKISKNLMFFLVFSAAAIDHTTPASRVANELILKSGYVTQGRQLLQKGSILKLVFDAPQAVMAVPTIDSDLTIYIGLMDPDSTSYTSDDWYVLEKDNYSRGFMYMGSHRAIVEFVANTDNDRHMVTTAYLGQASGHDWQCEEVYPGSNGSYYWNSLGPESSTVSY